MRATSSSRSIAVMADEFGRIARRSSLPSRERCGKGAGRIQQGLGLAGEGQLPAEAVPTRSHRRCRPATSIGEPFVKDRSEFRGRGVAYREDGRMTPLVLERQALRPPPEHPAVARKPEHAVPER